MISPMKSTIKAFAIDCDGTLFSSLQTISSKNQSAFKTLTENGCIPFFATSRPILAIKKFVSEQTLKNMNYMNCSPGVFLNGCYVLGKNGKVLLKEKMSFEDIKSCLYLLKDLDTKDKSFVCGHDHISPLSVIEKEFNSYESTLDTSSEMNLSDKNKTKDYEKQTPPANSSSYKQFSQSATNEELNNSNVKKEQDQECSVQTTQENSAQIDQKNSLNPLSENHYTSDTHNSSEIPQSNHNSKLEEKLLEKIHKKEAFMKTEDNLDPLDWVTILVYSNAENTISLKDKINTLLPKTLLCHQVSPLFLEIFLASTNKKTGIELILKDEGLDFNCLAAIGDNENDLPMLEASSFPVAMGNAKQICKDIAKLVVDTNENSGFSEAVDVILKSNSLINDA